MSLKRIVPLFSKEFVLNKHNLYKTISPHGSFGFVNKSNLYTLKMENKDNIVWIDMELTGLDVENDKILEVACLVTNKELEIISTKFQVIIHQPDDLLEKMDDWNKTTHTKTGLISDVRKSNIDVKEAENQLLNFLKPFTVQGSCPLAGNSIWMDRIYLRKFMPVIDNYLNYRIVDVSSIKELCKRWSPDVFYKAPKKRLTHRALEDIEDSVEELCYYKKNFINIIQ